MCRFHSSSYLCSDKNNCRNQYILFCGRLWLAQMQTYRNCWTTFKSIFQCSLRTITKIICKDKRWIISHYNYFLLVNVNAAAVFAAARYLFYLAQGMFSGQVDCWYFILRSTIQLNMPFRHSFHHTVE